MTNQNIEKWEKRFDKKFAGEWGDKIDIQIRLKSFIHNLLLADRKETLNNLWLKAEKEARHGVYGIEINKLLEIFKDLSPDTKKE